MATCICGAILLASCAQGDSENGSAAGGHAGPSFVSLNPCTDAILLEIADPQQILAISHYSHDPRSSSILPDKAGQFASTGGTVEEILALDPDIVIAGSFISPASRQALLDLDIGIELFGSTNDVEQSYAQIQEIGILAGHRDRAEDLIARIEHSLAENRPERGHRPIGTTIWQPGQIVPGEATLVNDLMQRTGFASHSQARGLGQADYLPLENVIADPPELLLVAGDSRAHQHPALAGLEGVRIKEFDPSLIYCGGPTIIRAVERLAVIRESLR